MTTYKNPIILCDYSDPDVIRVADIFFLTASSFNFTPGLPILTSSDLVHWTLVNYAAKEIPLPGYEVPQNAHGLWAPSIRYHNGEFFIFVATPDEGIFYTKTRNPYGAWSPLTPVWRGRGFEDPCPLWDDDGRLYVVHGYVKSRIGFNSKLGLLELDPETMQVKTDTGNETAADKSGVPGDRIIFDGTKTQPTIEGPKFYKRDGWYYIFAPAGGVTTGWQTVLRSRNVAGPYEEKIVLVQGTSPINGPHQGALVDTPAGEEWFIHFQDRGIYGRICLLEPTVWGSDGWPRMGTAVETDTLPGEPYTEYRMPDCSRPAAGAGDHTLSAVPGDAVTCALPGADLAWQWSANARADFARVLPDGAVRLSVLDTRKDAARALGGFPLLWESANVLTQKIASEHFTFAADFDVSVLDSSDQSGDRKASACRTGMVFLGDDYASVAVEKTNKGLFLVYFESESDGGDDRRTERVQFRVPLALGTTQVHITLQFTGTSPSAGEAVFTAQSTGLSEPWRSPVYKTKNAHWVGGRFGVYAVGQGEGHVKVLFR